MKQRLKIYLRFGKSGLEKLIWWKKQTKIAKEKEKRWRLLLDQEEDWPTKLLKRRSEQ